MDFLIPLWAGIALGADPAQIGYLVALELIVSVIARPIAGRLADSRRRELIAGLGALLYGVSCCGYALAGSMPVAYTAAALGGLGGALLWVSVRAMVGEHLPGEPGVFARLMSVQETGVWVAFVAGLLLLGRFDSFPMVFLAAAATCLVAALILFLSPPRAGTTPGGSSAQERPALFAPQASRILIVSLRPMLAATVVTALAETMIGILLLLHLQRALGLGVIEIAYVFLPGAIALGVLPPILHRVVVRIGRRAGMVAGSVCSGAFALSLAYASGPVVIAALWVLCGVAWAVVIPIEQAVITEKHPHQVGAAMGIYTAATLIGSATGAALAGVLYEAASWQLTCLIAGAIILSGTALGPWAIRRLGVADKPLQQVASNDAHPRERTGDPNSH
ncbi:MFS transporter [Arthrobacter echini]|uniref:MFS transporter n=1 Tax=Arthrobacter echini TaxID=1529066 RepID=A0A5D0XJB5_9MICC|nr:MFS transporter [Arthrobacter echini]